MDKNIDSPPLVSVVLSVYNGADHLEAALNSILEQSYQNFELIIINDGSTDDTKKIIQSYHDSRIVLIDRENRGLVASLNEGIQKARGEYIARQDADDWSSPQRLSKQVAFLDAHPEIGLVASFANLVDAKGQAKGSYQTPYLSLDLKRRLHLGNTFVHGSVMVRRQLLLDHPYVTAYGPTEDYVVWGQLLAQTEFATIPEALYTYEVHEGGVSAFNSREDVQLTAQAREDLWSHDTFPDDTFLGIVKRGRSYRADHPEVYPGFVSDQVQLFPELWRHQYRRQALLTLMALSCLRPLAGIRALSTILRRTS